MSWPQRHQVRLRLFPLALAGLASQHLGERMYGLFPWPDHLGQITGSPFFPLRNKMTPRGSTMPGVGGAAG